MITFRKVCMKIAHYSYHISKEITRKWYGSFRDMAYIISYSNRKITVPLRSAVKSSTVYKPLRKQGET